VDAGPVFTVLPIGRHLRQFLFQIIGGNIESTADHLVEKFLCVAAEVRGRFGNLEARQLTSEYAIGYVDAIGCSVT
jgi:hypothetical protein